MLIPYNNEPVIGKKYRWDGSNLTVFEIVAEQGETFDAIKDSSDGAKEIIRLAKSKTIFDSLPELHDYWGRNLDKRTEIKHQEISLLRKEYTDLTRLVFEML